ncbi:MAG: GEVED domain-containing protein [Planctomycetota bacterium]
MSLRDFRFVLGRGLRRSKISHHRVEKIGSSQTNRNRWRPKLEALEERRVLATFLVTTLEDAPLGASVGDGQLSLREAIEASNQNVSIDGSPVGMEGFQFDGFDLVTDEIQFASDLTGELQLTQGQFEIFDTLVISGNGADRLSLNANQNSRHFEITSDVLQLELRNMSLVGGNVDGEGGSIKVAAAATLELIGVRAEGNTAMGNGGAISSSSGIVLRRSSLIGNEAGQDGGAAHVQDIILQDSLLALNTAGGNGGGYYRSGPGTTLVRNATIVGNEATNDGAGVYHVTFGGGDTIVSSIVAGNFLTDGTAKDFRRDSLSSNPSFLPKPSYNIFGTAIDTNGIENHINIDWKSVVESVDDSPLITDNGGSIPTLRILPDSIAVDAGDPLIASSAVVDVRGLNRVVDGDEDGVRRVDIGALEEERTFVRVSVEAVEEIVSETGQAQFRVSLNRELPEGETLSVDFSFSPDSTATIGEDFGDSSQTLLFMARESLVQTVDAAILEDSIAEPAETIIATISAERSFAVVDPSKKSASATIADDDEAGFIISKDSLVVQEDGSDTDTFSVVLTGPPSEFVNIGFTSQGLVRNPGRLIFLPENWNVPQTVEISAADNNIAFGDTVRELFLSVNRASSSPFDELPSQQVDVLVVDDDVVAMIIEPFSLVSGEDGTKASFAVSFASAFLQGSVTVPVQSLDVSEGLPDVDSLTFTNSNWNIPQIVTVTGIDDAEVDGSQEYQIQLGPMDAGSIYDGFVGPPVTIVNADNESDSFDFGDAATAAQSGFVASYPTSMDEDGARHVIGDLRLGSLIDAEADGAASSSADADNSTGEADEDGMTQVTSLLAHPTSNTSGTISVFASDTGFLDAWIDFNRDGDWDDAGEQIFASTELVGGPNLLPVSVPAGSSSGATFARLRFSTTGGLQPTGAAIDGEVEDYQVQILDGSLPVVAMATIPFETTLTVEEVGDDLVLRGDGTVLFQAPAADLRLDLTSTVPATLQLANLGLVSDEKLRFAAQSTDDLLVLPELPEDLELSNIPSDSLAGLERIRLDAGPGTLTYAEAGVESVTGAENFLIIEHAAETPPAFSPGWEMMLPQIVAGTFLHRNSSGGATVGLQNSLQHQNPTQPLDTDFSGEVSAIDALLLIDALNQGGGELPVLSSVPENFFYADVSGDDFLSAIDALLVIDFLNTPQNGEGEESPSFSTVGGVPLWNSGASQPFSSSSVQVVEQQATKEPKRDWRVYGPQEGESNRDQIFASRQHAGPPRSQNFDDGQEYGVGDLLVIDRLFAHWEAQEVEANKKDQGNP